MPSTFYLSSIAYIKLVLHAAKYAVNPVCGVLIGKAESGLPDARINVTDAVPLFHTHPLTPILEVALQQIQVYCTQTEVEIVGFYCANEGYADKEVSATTAKIASRIDENIGGGALLLMLDASKLEGNSNVAVIPHTLTNGGWKPLQSNHLVAPTLTTPITKHIKESAYEDLFDFDNHLDNVKLDWLINERLVQAVKA